MRCQVCGKYARVHLLDVIDGSPRVQHFCREHGKTECLPEQPTEGTLKLTRSDIERGAVSVPLPGGKTMQMSLPPEMQEGDDVRLIFKFPPLTKESLFGPRSAIDEDTSEAS